MSDKVFKEPLFSIITPTYNHEFFIKDCIESVLSQIYKNWELIIVDDGSTDNTFSIAKKYMYKYPNIRVFQQVNKGPFRLDETYNFALSKSNGEYIAILEGDDSWLENKLVIQNKAFISNPDAILSWGKVNFIAGDSNKIIKTLPVDSFDYYNNKPFPIILHSLYFNNFIPAVSIIIKKESLLEIGGFKSLEGLPLVDYPTLLELALLGEFCFIDKILANWRIYSTQVTKRFTMDIRIGLYNSGKAHYLKNRHNSLLDTFNWDDVEINYKNELIISYSRSGRYSLIRKEFSDARKDYYKSISIGGFTNVVWKLRSLVGILFSFFKLDVEGLSKILGKVSYK